MTADTGKILISGAASNVGSAVLDILVSADADPRRDEGACEKDRGVEAVVGDFLEPESLAPALERLVWVLKSLCEQVSDGLPGATELFVEPDAEVVQRFPSLRNALATHQLAGPLPPLTESIELIVDTRRDLLDAGDPSPESSRPWPTAVAFGRADESRPVAIGPPPVILLTPEVLVDYVRSRGSSGYAPQSGAPAL